MRLILEFFAVLGKFLVSETGKKMQEDCMGWILRTGDVCVCEGERQM